MKYDCLIIDDEKVLCDSTCEYFNMFGVKTAAAYSEGSARFFLRDNEVSLILLDINLGDGSGFEFCRFLRESTDIPIFFISARNSDDDKLIALNIGGDDYIEKPYSLGVLLAKVRVTLKRYGSRNSADEPAGEYVNGNLRIDRINKCVYVDGEMKKLKSMEYALLDYMSQNPGRLITKQEFFDNVWKDRFTSDGTLNVHIRHLREAVEKDANEPVRIITVWKEGYRWQEV